MRLQALARVLRPGQKTFQLGQKLLPSHLLCGCDRQLRFQKLEKDPHLNPEQTFLPAGSRTLHQLMKWKEQKLPASQLLEVQREVQQQEELQQLVVLRPPEEQLVLQLPEGQQVPGEPELPERQQVLQRLVLLVQLSPNLNR